MMVASTMVRMASVTQHLYRGAGDAVFDSTLRQGLTVQLNSHPSSASSLMHPADIAGDGPATRCAAHTRGGAGNL
jgi:hypothetical protein